MKKKNWKKRIVLAGLMGTMVSISLSGCAKSSKNASGVSNMKEADGEITECLFENANGEWEHYSNIIHAQYIDINTGERNYLIMGLEKNTTNEEETEKKYRSLSKPEVVLVEIQNKNNYSVDYNWEVGENTDFSKDNELVDYEWGFGISGMSYDEIVKQEEQMKKYYEEENNLRR